MRLAFHSHLKGKVENCSKVLDGGEMALDPKVKIGLVEHILFLEKCVIGQLFQDFCISNGKIEIASIIFAKFPLDRG